MHCMETPSHREVLCISLLSVIKTYSYPWNGKQKYMYRPVPS